MKWSGRQDLHLRPLRSERSRLLLTYCPRNGRVWRYCPASSRIQTESTTFILIPVGAPGRNALHDSALLPAERKLHGGRGRNCTCTTLVRSEGDCLLPTGAK